MPGTTIETFTMDVATLSRALSALGVAIGTTSWHSPFDDQSPQAQFLDWHNRNESHVLMLSQLEAMASARASDLNAFLQGHGFKPMFRDFTQGGVGAAAILDMVVNWAVPAQLTNIVSYSASNYRPARFTGFEVPLEGAAIYEVGGDKLVKLLTKEGDALWLLKSDVPVSHPFDMVAQAENAMAGSVGADTTWISSVIVPCVEIKTTTTLDWMFGLTAGDHYIDQAFQMVKIGMDEKGAYAKVATGLGTTRGISPRKPVPLVFDRPFYGWFTQANNSIPTACFFAGEDSWRQAR
ncbi:hypothetical protein EOL96_01415 [Candidatus Saccharibacteria bacterium]|nr:hypothetical protein [Candidatus Saccharibacteria bacterium]